MNVLYRRPIRLLLVVVAAIFSLLFTDAVVTAPPAHAGEISCGNARWVFANRTAPSSQIHIWHPGLCQPYSDILTVSGDNVWLDYTGGGYMILSPRTACDFSTSAFAPRGTWRNPSYTQNYYIWVEDYGYNFQTWIWLCNNY